MPSTAATAPAGLPGDGAAHGYVGLCDESGHNVTGGDTRTVPFIWKAIASTPAPAQFRGTGANAVLNAYQPRPQVAPAEWSGASLTAASFYSTATRPTVQATYGDLSLAQFLSDFPAMVNGLVVLRMHYGKADYGLYNATYPATVIQVVGHRWSVVSGGTVDCSKGRAVSNEQLTGVVTKSQYTPRSTPPAAQTTARSGRAAKPAVISRAPAARGGAGAASPATGDAASTASATGESDNGSADDWLWFAVPLAVVLLAGGALLWRRRTTPPTS